MNRKKWWIGWLLVICMVVLAACGGEVQPRETAENVSLDEIPEYDGTPYVAINGNVPFFTQEDLTEVSFEEYGELDELGRCTVAYASVGQDLMPTEKRGAIGQVKPSGWQVAKYDSVDGKYLYNRCHLIGYQLTAENANERNLITGTRYMNVDGMLPFENMVADYVKGTGNHCLYRVTPIFRGNNLVADGVLMEAESVEDEGEGILFNVFCYNVQPGIEINYANGESRLAEETQRAEESEESVGEYVLNTKNKKFHLPSCSSVGQMKEENKEEYVGRRSGLIEAGYEPCGSCKP